MTDHDDKADQQAAREARRAKQAEEAPLNRAEYEAKIVATREKTDRLRAERLAREAEADEPDAST